MQTAMGVILGVLAVEFVIYFWHRFVEHGRFALAKRHIIHHEVLYPAGRRPTAKYLNARAWSWAIPVASIAGFSLAALPLGLAIAVAGGAVAYGALLLKVHNLFHVRDHRLWLYGWWHRLVQLHEQHHRHDCNYGILLFGMDRLFGTYRP